jgi:hypothetical protein
MSKDKKGKDKIYQGTPHLIFCEGADAYFFLIWLLDFFKKDNPAFNVFRVYDFGGIAQLELYLRNFAKTDDFKNIVRSLCIIRDAERDANSACQSIQAALRNCGFAVPAEACSWTPGDSTRYSQIPTGFLLFPSCNATPQAGTLEDLCLGILAKEEAETVLSSADVALEPYKGQLSRPHKNRLHTYFSLTDAFVSLKVGEAAKAQAFRWDAPEINSLKSFLARIAGA